MRRVPVVAAALVGLLPTSAAAADWPSPQPGVLYHGVHPSGISGDETFGSFRQLTAYERAVGRKAAWVYFSQEWWQGVHFPVRKARAVQQHGSLPVIRLMLRSRQAYGGRQGADPDYALDRVLAGDFDAGLRTWAAGARDYGGPVLAEFGTEVNGVWFGWNGRWNGAGGTAGYGDPQQPDGPERFRDAYRHVVDVIRSEQATNVGFMFHADAEDYPRRDWNRMEGYYPGDSYVDVVGLSAYGSQTPLDDYVPTRFRTKMDRAIARTGSFAPDKPVALIEFGNARGSRVDSVRYARGALRDLLSGRWPTVIGFSWWNESWPNDDVRAHNSVMRVQQQPRVARVFRHFLRDEKILSAYP